MHNPSLKHMCIEHIVFEGTVSQICDRGPGSFFKKYRKNIQKKKKSYPFFDIKQKLRPE